MPSGRPPAYCDSGSAPEKTARSERITGEAATLLGHHAGRLPTADDFLTDQDYIGPGYGVATPECLEAIAMLARCEAIFLDPVYSGKALAGLIDHVRRGAVGPDETVVFLHTGGTPALFADVAQLGDLIAAQ